jgi:hypothetical protein
VEGHEKIIGTHGEPREGIALKSRGADLFA